MGISETILRILEFIAAVGFLCLTAALAAYLAKERHISGILLVTGGIALAISVPLLIVVQRVSQS